MLLPRLDGPRLTLRPARVDDLEFFADLNSDAEVMAHVSGRAASRSDTVEEWTRRVGERSDRAAGLGYWVGSADGRAIGRWGLGRTESDPRAAELGFRLRREHWRKGFGAEGARMLLAHAFTDLAVTRVWAGTVTANIASRRTLEAVGLEQVDEPSPGVLTFEVTRSQWRERA
ncbi:GNAT family N-acetyltransferase [Nocardioides sp. zg-1308]|uniref:GNAT family N-acetyltransferase n=1 Tax=Nocardioides sp. zg-1308 TaxID=2736253 RepID=UPI001551CBCB|nr:GNAT family N-acetyltransferase [Nocardioides sp. zg-1308]